MVPGVVYKPVLKIAAVFNNVNTFILDVDIDDADILFEAVTVDVIIDDARIEDARIFIAAIDDVIILLVIILRVVILDINAVPTVKSSINADELTLIDEKFTKASSIKLIVPPIPFAGAIVCILRLSVAGSSKLYNAVTSACNCIKAALLTNEALLIGVNGETKKGFEFVFRIKLEVPELTNSLIAASI